MKTSILIAGMLISPVLAAQHPAEGSDTAASPLTERVQVCFDRGGGHLDGSTLTRVLRAPSVEEIEAARRSLEASGQHRGGPGGVETILDNGRSDKRIDLVFVGDGYTAAEIEQYRVDVDALVASLFEREPFKTYKTRFNVHRVDVVSSESGVDNDPVPGVSRETALDMEFWCNGIERALCVDSSKARAFSALAPDDDQVIAIANSRKYGGAAFFGTQIACVSARSTSAGSTLVHELGHSLFTLEDEYQTGGPTTYTGAEFGRTNLSIYDEAEQISRESKWWYWMGESIAGLDGPTGAYEGGHYSRRGVFRPSPNSMMRNLGRPFNAPSMEQAVRAIHTTGDPWPLFESHTGPIGGVFHGHHHTFEIEPNHPATYDLTVWWQLGPQILEGVVGSRVNICDLQLQPGQYVLVAKVRDGTPWVGSELIREQVLTSNIWWHIVIETPPADRNADGEVTVADLLDFVDDFAASDSSADLEGRDGVFDLADIVAFVRLFTGDCG